MRGTLPLFRIPAPRLRTPAPRLRAALAGAAAVALLAGCGGGSGTTSASGSSSSIPPTSEATSTSAAAAAGGSDFCTAARSFATEAGQAVAGGTTSADAGQQLQTLVSQLKAITPPAAIAADWQSATTALEQFAQDYQGVNLNDPAQVQALEQKVAPLTQQLTTSGNRIDQYLQTQCGISTGDTSESASPSS